MWKIDVNYILDKYWDIIKEEINVKDISIFWDDVKIKKIFKPLWSKLSEKFWKDTGDIIKFWKMWKIEELENWNVKVFCDSWNEWILNNEDYEIAYEWLQWDDFAIDWNLISKLDLKLTPELKKEWMAREVSRFLNQMRKDVDYKVDAKVDMFFDTNSEYMKEVINSFQDFFKSEVLLKSINNESKKDWDIVSVFNIDENAVTFSLKK